MKEFSALLREADEVEMLEAQVKEKEDELSRLRKSLDVLRNCNEELLRDNDVLTRDLCESETCLKELQEHKQVTKKSERAPECLHAILNRLRKRILSGSLLLAVTGFSRFPRLPPRRKFSNNIYASKTSLPRLEPNLPQEYSNNVNWYQ